MQQKMMQEKVPQDEKLVRFLRQAGHELADYSRVPQDSIGILCEDPKFMEYPSRFTSYLSWLLGRGFLEPKKPVLAVIWTAPLSGRFGVDSNTWVIEYYIPESVDKIKEIATDLSNQFGVVIRLIRRTEGAVLVDLQDKK